jgi:hypothetical protein
MSSFKPMVKMMTTEPTVELKLKKGGHVAKHHKKHEEHHEGHKKAVHKAMGGLGVLSDPKIATPPAAPRVRVGKPSLGARMAAMKGMSTPMMAKKGGKAHHHAHGGKIEKEVKHLEKELHHHEGMKAKKAHHGLKDGGKVSEFENTKMDTAHKDTAHGTGGVKMGAAGYKHGGKAHHAHGGKVHHISGHPVGSHEHHKHMAKHHAEKHKEGGSTHHHKMHEHHKHLAKMAKGGVANFAETKMDTAHHDSAHGTGEVKEGKPGGYKHGGKMHHKATGGVIEGKPAGYKRGGHVEDAGAPVDMPQGKKRASAAVKIDQLSGTFKHGGKVHHKAHGGKMKDMC